MKKIIISIILIMSAQSLLAQKVINGDLNHDDNLNVSDIANIINTILGIKDKEYVATGEIDPFMVDNSKIVGKWYYPDSSLVLFNADGSTNLGEGYTYKYRPYQRKALIYDADGAPIDFYEMLDVNATKLVLHKDGASIVDRYGKSILAKDGFIWQKIGEETFFSEFKNDSWNVEIQNLEGYNLYKIKNCYKSDVDIVLFVGADGTVKVEPQKAWFDVWIKTNESYVSYYDKDAKKLIIYITTFYRETYYDHVIGTYKETLYMP